MLALISLSRTNKIRQEKKCLKKFTQYVLLEVAEVRDVTSSVDMRLP
jgi:hypothetical protein